MRQAGKEPFRSVIEVPEPGEELLAVPVSAHAIELLAQPPAGRVAAPVPVLRQKQGRRLGLGRCLPGRRRQRTTDAGFLHGIAPEFTEMLAGAPLDAQRLISPGGAGTGINAT